MKRYVITFIIIFICIYSCEYSNEIKNESGIFITKAEVREIPPGSEVTAGYMEIKNNTNLNEKLVKVRSECFDKIEIHNIVTDEDETVKMEKVRGVIINSGETVEFKPGSFHLMLSGVKCDLATKEELTLTLYFQKLGKKVINATIIKIDADYADDKN